MTAAPPLSWHERGTLLGILDARLTPSMQLPPPTMRLSHI